MLKCIFLQNSYHDIFFSIIVGLNEIWSSKHSLVMGINMLNAYLSDSLNFLFFLFMGSYLFKFSGVVQV
jgi:hypothetical protein